MTSPKSKEQVVPEELSEDAKNLVCAMFFPGAKARVRSHPPHAFYKQHEAAFKELLAHELISAAPYNSYGVTEYCGTEACEWIWRTHGRARLEEQAAALLGKG